MKPYMHVDQLAMATPWSAPAIRTMMSRGVLREGQHYFKVGRRPVFKWSAVVEFIEGTGEPKARIAHYREERRG